MFKQQGYYLIAEIALMLVAMLSMGTILYNYMIEPRNYPAIVVAGMIFAAALVVLVRLWFDPDRIRARQSDNILRLANRMTTAMESGLNQQSAQAICEILLPATSASAVAITNTENILGYAGVGKELNALGSPIRTVATHLTLKDGQMRVLHTAAEIGFPEGRTVINAAILVPLSVSGETVGTLKFYFPNAHRINATQQSIATGFGELLSTQMAAAELDEQKKLATSMELQMLQSQINPHFLFNTINTIASFVRTDPAKARTLLREFAAFYRGTLEDPGDLVTLSREVEQTKRYLGLEIARFGEERLQMVTNVPEDLQEMMVPAFLVQPLAENAVKHAMPAEGKLTITVSAQAQGSDLLVSIADDGIGMSEDVRDNIMQQESSTGLGIAVRNIHERVRGYYGPESNMTVESEEGHGTTVTLLLKNGAAPRH